MFIKNCWYVAGWASEVGPDNLLARIITGIPVVMWRNTEGKVIAFEDRCCHRGAPLSIGRHEGDSVRCMYHGLRFVSDGTCVEIPAQDQIPDNVRARAFPMVEQHKWLWIWMGDPAKANPADIPETPWLSDEEHWHYKEGQLHYGVNYLLIADNLLDLSHAAFVHAKTLGGTPEYAEFPAEVKPIENGVHITRWATNIDPPPYMEKIKDFHGKIDRWNKYDFLLPGIFLMDSGMAPVGTGAMEGKRVNAAELRSCQAITPETENSTHYFFCLPHNFALDKPEITDKLHEGIVTAFHEDLAMITAQARQLALDPDFPMAAIRADRALGIFRALVKRTLDMEAATATPPKRKAQPEAATL